jgi:hypothetical protein
VTDYREPLRETGSTRGRQAGSARGDHSEQRPSPRQVGEALRPSCTGACCPGSLSLPRRRLSVRLPIAAAISVGDVAGVRFGAAMAQVNTTSKGRGPTPAISLNPAADAIGKARPNSRECSGCGYSLLAAKPASVRMNNADGPPRHEYNRFAGLHYFCAP